MEERRQSVVAGNKTSSIPKPLSRLPKSSIPTRLANKATSVSASADAPRLPPSDGTSRRQPSDPSASGSTVPKTRLRTSASRDHLRSSKSLSNLRNPSRSNVPSTGPPPALRDTQHRNRDRLYDSREHGSQGLEDAGASVFKRPLVPRRRPSTHFTPAPQHHPIQEDTSYAFEDEDPVVLPPLSNNSEEGLTFDALLEESNRPLQSLNDRTIETLARVAASPAIKRRGSNFIDTEPFRRPQSKDSNGSRPGSSSQSGGLNGRALKSLSRPASSSGRIDNHQANFRASTDTHMIPLTPVQGTPLRRSTAVGTSTTPTGQITTIPKLSPRSTLSKLPYRGTSSASIDSQASNLEKQEGTSVPALGLKTGPPRSLKPRASMTGLLKKSSMSCLNKLQPAPNSPVGSSRKASLASVKSLSTCGAGRNPSSASTVSTALTIDSVNETPASTIRKSSAALREQISKAKAVKRATFRQTPETKSPGAEDIPVIPTDDTFDFGLSGDPFGQCSFEDANRKDMEARISTARTTGRLNIAAMGLKEIPEGVLRMYDLASIGRSDSTWAESVDLTRLVAADNEMEVFKDAIFPDVDPRDLSSDEDDKGQIFWGLESADFHNNTLISLPLGLRRLQMLTSLNLASNQLANSCLEVLSQCSNLRDLKLSNNLLYGAMDDCFLLENLEILDLHGNNISALPPRIDQMRRLRILNIDENALESLPSRSLSELPLTELFVRRNKLAGTLFDSEVEGFPQLQTLDCTNNQLMYIVSPDRSQPLIMPSLHQLSVATNRIKSLPDMRTWTSVVTINADENNIATFPEGFTGLLQLRHAGFAGNDIRTIPSEIARMDRLAMLRITGNPLRDRKFTSMTTEDLKDALAARLGTVPASEAGQTQHTGAGISPSGSNISPNMPSSTTSKSTPMEEDDDDDEGLSDFDDFATPPTSAPQSPARSRAQTLSSQTWPVKPGGVLDRSSTQSSSLHPVVCSKIAVDHTIREVRLAHNLFTQLPNSLSFFTDTLTSLSLSHNQLTGESWLTEQLDLTALRELNLQSNFITSLTPLTTQLCAPNLEKLDISFNRVVQIPILRNYFPGLTLLLLSNNRVEELEPDAVRGMKVVDASNNEIAHLNPRLGLLSLERLDVMGNRFRVPRWNVLERGTESTLRFLRGRIPVAEMAEWKAKEGRRGEEHADNEFD